MHIEKALSLLQEDERFRILRKVDIARNHKFSEINDDESTGLLAVIDTETTGFSPNSGDRIIDLSIATCLYGQDSGVLYKVVSRYEGLEDPDVNIPENIQALTGITDAMVKGKCIDDEAVAQVMDGVGLVICHNANFDRMFLESRFPAFANKNFACSLTEIPWSEWGISSQKLDYLGFRYGAFHEGHRAKTDVDMLLYILDQKEAVVDKPILSILLEYARKTSYRIYAIGLPFDKKDIAKARGYHWSNGTNGNPKAWWIDTLDETEELKFLLNNGCSSPSIRKLTAKERYRPAE